MGEQAVHTERIEWCDVYKGILMVLVVVGHSTGMFNRFIYQFHMAAFFMISGYVSRLDKKSLFRMIIDKFVRIMIPFFFLGMCGDTAFYILNRLGVLDKVSTTVYPVSLQQAIVGLFSKDLMIYCDWLGALWFLPVLFIATILAKIIFFLAKEKGKWMLLISVLIFYISEKDIVTGNTIMVLSGLAQFYFVTGVLLRRVIEKDDKHERIEKYAGLLAVLLCVLWYVCSNYFIKVTVDWPSKRFNGVLQDILLPIFGTTVMYIFAHLFTNFPITNKVFSHIGKNTMGIMSFHFVGFKVAYTLSILLGCMRVDEFRLLTPPSELGNTYWFVTVLISICISLLLWRGLNKVKIISFLLGNSKVTVSGQLGREIESIINFFSDTFKEMYARIDRRMYKCLYFVMAIAFILFATKNIMEITDNMDCISVVFPDNSSNVDFKNGWLPQGDGENYRWIEQISNFDVLLGNQTELHLEGYVPDNVSNMSKVAIYVNDYAVFERDLDSGESFIYDIPIHEHVKKYAENDIRIEFDGSRVPKETDADQRVFSALINVIEIQ